jgi:hypothetical protein
VFLDVEPRLKALMLRAHRRRPGETSVTFLATGYSLGVLLSAGLGAALGPLLLRWR